MQRRAHIDRRAKAVFYADIWDANEACLALRVAIAIALAICARGSVRTKIRVAICGWRK